MSITAMTIRNFRSIQYFNDRLRDLNIFVGQNDKGKSNILRALNLFFNGNKRHGYELDWPRDYCAFAPPRKQKAEEITVMLEVTPPEHFKNSKPLQWKKLWRKEGLHFEGMRHADGTEIGPWSKLRPFLRSMRFDYVPAIKGEDYFQALMSSLHDMLEATVEEQVRAASSAFTETITENTTAILQDIRDRLGLETTIELPPNLRDLFAQLEFTSVSGEKPFSLKQRGDGIKVRHVPIVLRWLAEQANYLSAPGRPKAVTVWGYEEPENNLELRRCFDLARDFVDGSSAIQAFVTTHSPAFYSVCRDSDPDKVGLFLVTKGDSPPTTKIRRLCDEDWASLDSSMGLLDFLEPHFKEARQELEHLRQVQAQLQDTSKPTLFCEGPSDKALLEKGLHEFFPAAADKVAVKCSDRHGGGHEWVADMLIAWSFSRPTAKAMGLFDKDEAAQKTRGRLEERVKDAGKQHVSWRTLVPGEDLKQCFSEGFTVPHAIEELFPESVWDHAEAEGWLEDRKRPVVLYGFDRTDVTFNDYVQEALPNAHQRRLVLKKVRLGSKEAFCDYVSSIMDDAREAALEGLKPTLQNCLQALDILEDPT